jgi:hypothetical protein
MIIFFSTMSEGTGKRLLQSIEEVVSEKDLELCRNTNALFMMLCRPRNGATIAILHTSSEREFADIFPLRDLLLDIRVILVMPDSDPKTLSKGHLLRPRFMTDCNSDFKEITAVLKRMIENLDINKRCCG